MLYKSPGVGEIAFQAAAYWRALREQGITIGRVDALVAATAKVHKLVLVTYNRDHYPLEEITLYQSMPELE